VLACDVAEVRRLAILDGPLPGRVDSAASYRDLVGRRGAREPLQHLTGVAPFRHLELAVGPVLGRIGARVTAYGDGMSRRVTALAAG
jgi:hypothetical protein